MTHSVRISLGPVQDVACAGPTVVSLPPDTSGRPRTALVVRDAEGALHAYLNECRHIPIPLDAGPGATRVMDKKGRLRCLTHGAVYRVSDGLCVQGPCTGLSLFQVALEIDDGSVFLVVPLGQL